MGEIMQKNNFWLAACCCWIVGSTVFGMERDIEKNKKANWFIRTIVCCSTCGANEQPSPRPSKVASMQLENTNKGSDASQTSSTGSDSSQHSTKEGLIRDASIIGNLVRYGRNQSDYMLTGYVQSDETEHPVVLPFTEAE
jgi:hypothetical protein